MIHFNGSGAAFIQAAGVGIIHAGDTILVRVKLDSSSGTGTAYSQNDDPTTNHMFGFRPDGVGTIIGHTQTAAAGAKGIYPAVASVVGTAAWVRHKVSADEATQFFAVGLGAFASDLSASNLAACTFFSLGAKLANISGTVTLYDGLVGTVGEFSVHPNGITDQQLADINNKVILPEQVPGCRHSFGCENTTTGLVCKVDGTTTLALFGSGTTVSADPHPVTRTAPDTTAPTVASVAVANGTPSVVNLTMSESMDTGSVPAASAFTVSGHTVSSVAITGNTINLTLSAPFVYGEAARTVAYTQPGTNNARDLAATPNLLANFTGQAITNNVAAPGDTTAPGFSLAQVLNSAPTQIVITMNETLAAYTPAASAFVVSGGKTVSSVARSGATITLTCSAAYAYGDTITVTYTKPGTNMLQDAAGNQTASFGPSPVTNNIASPSGALVTPPGFFARFPGGMPLVSEAGKVQFLSKTDLTSTGVLAGPVAKTTNASGVIAAWTQAGLVAGTAYRMRFISDVDGQESECDVTPS